MSTLVNLVTQGWRSDRRDRSVIKQHLPPLKGGEGQKAENRPATVPMLSATSCLSVHPREGISFALVFFPIYFHINILINGARDAHSHRGLLSGISFCLSQPKAGFQGNTVNCSRVTDTPQACHKPHELNDEQKQAGN